MSMIRLTLLMGLLTLLLVFLGGMLFGESGAILALIFSAAMNLFSYWNSDKIVLRMYNATEVDDRSAPELMAIVRELAGRARLPMPRVYIIESPMANAFATGRDPEHAAVAVTTGILSILNRSELEGVIAHELGHIRNRDILIGTIAAVLAGAISMLAQMGQWSLFFGGYNDEDEGGNPIFAILAIILMPIAAMLVQMAISRSREYKADETAASLTHNPLGLAHALRKLATATEQLPAGNVNPATSHLFIVNPLSGASLRSLFSTHPPIEERIARLERMGLHRA